MAYDAVLLIAFGSPEKMEDVRPFLANVTKGRPVPPHRLEEVVRHYELFGGRSPLNAITFRQAAALQELLELEGPRMPVYVGMRNWHPYLHETLAQMSADGVSRALGFILSAQQSEAGWERYQQNVAEACVQVGPNAPRVDCTDEWHAHPLFIDAVVDLTKQALARVPNERRSETPLIFTAHSVPTDLPSTPLYVRQIEEGSRLVAERLGHTAWSVAYQSRSGDPRTPWLEPDIGAVLRQLAEKKTENVVVSPIGFVCDHIEVLYDLDTEARHIAEQHGIKMIRASAVNDHPTFIRMMAEVVRKARKFRL
ncbi:MAG: ferrochelatase [Deltaproteobacteria bacterium]|nr:ferrochelatase [Deltaproteobacteria bacterium]